MSERCGFTSFRSPKISDCTFKPVDAKTYKGESNENLKVRSKSEKPAVKHFKHKTNRLKKDFWWETKGRRASRRLTRWEASDLQLVLKFAAYSGFNPQTILNFEILLRRGPFLVLLGSMADLSAWIPGPRQNAEHTRTLSRYNSDCRHDFRSQPCILEDAVDWWTTQTF